RGVYCVAISSMRSVHLSLFGNAQFRAARPGIHAPFLVGGLDWFWRDQFKIVIGVALRRRPLRLVQPLATAIAKEIFYDPIFEGMKCDYRDASSALEPRSQRPQAFFQCALFIVHFHAKRLKNLRGRMM